jgi:hypothetical protein
MRVGIAGSLFTHRLVPDHFAAAMPDDARSRRSQGNYYRSSKMKLTTTFSRLRKAEACTSGYKKLAAHLGGINAYGKDTQIDLLTILASNGLDDALWCLRATEQICDRVARLMAADFAESVLHIFEEKCPNDNRPRLAIQAARDFANGLIDAAACSAAQMAAYSAGYSAACSASHSAAYSAAHSGAYSAAHSGAYWAMSEIFKKYLAEGDNSEI